MPASPVPRRRWWLLSFLLLLCLLAWDAVGLDLPLARWFGAASGFAWRDRALFMLLTHELPRHLALALVLALAWGAWRPWGFLRRLAPWERLQLLASVLLALATVALLKRVSATSCPWDLAEFGGIARYVSHWAWALQDGGSGHCFPAGHASAALAFLAPWPLLRRVAPALAVSWLVWALACGMALGGFQQMRGAHYLSHTLWSAWICWTLGLALDGALHALRAQHRAIGPQASAAAAVPGRR